MQEIIYSLVIPVYKNESNIEFLYQEILKLSPALNFELFEVVLVVDGSPDNSAQEILRVFSEGKVNFKLIQHSRNFGAFDAIRTGLRKSSGTYTAVMAADLQEPIELISSFFSTLATKNFDIAVGVREEREDSWAVKINSKIFWYIFKKFVNKNIPASGVDVFCLNQVAKQSLLSMEEVRTSLIGQLYWLGFRRAEVKYKRKARTVGKSAWSFSKKVEYFLDSLFSFTDTPITLMIVFGFIGTIGFLLFGAYTVVAKLYGKITVDGFTTIIIVLVACQVLNILFYGILGAYVFRALENSRSRPSAIIQSEATFARTPS